jgi:hypothetical protein
MHSTTIGDVLALLSLVKTTYDNYTDSRSACLEVKAELVFLPDKIDESLTFQSRHLAVDLGGRRHSH